MVLFALLVIGAYLAYRALGSLQRAWTISRNDPLDAGQIKHEYGTVEVQGTVEQLEEVLLTTKYTDTPAVADDYKIQKNALLKIEGSGEIIP